jgi:hypothetical protein
MDIFKDRRYKNYFYPEKWAKPPKYISADLFGTDDRVHYSEIDEYYYMYNFWYFNIYLPNVKSAESLYKSLKFQKSALDKFKKEQK